MKNKWQWELWAEMIRSDQMSAVEVQLFLEENSEFAEWYRNKIAERGRVVAETEE